MKRLSFLALMLLLCTLLLAGCSSNETESSRSLEGIDLYIPEKMFMAQTNEVYVNAESYLGQTIALEGMFFSEVYEPTGLPLHLVMRYGPGCCGNDSNLGFEVRWEDGAFELPDNNAWVFAAGTLEQYEEDGFTYLRLLLSELEILPKRGKETVLQ